MVTDGRREWTEMRSLRGHPYMGVAIQGAYRSQAAGLVKLHLADGRIITEDLEQFDERIQWLGGWSGPLFRDGPLLSVPVHKRFQYWNHFVARMATSGPRIAGMTARKLAAVQALAIADDDLWQDVVLRHDGLRRTPEEMERDDPVCYDHCAGNFWGMLACLPRWG